MAVGKESIKRAANASAETGTKTRTTRAAKAVKETEAAEVKTAVVTPVDKRRRKPLRKRQLEAVRYRSRMNCRYIFCNQRGEKYAQF